MEAQVKGFSICDRHNAKWLAHHKSREITLQKNKFLSEDDKIFTVGSCFAEYIRYELDSNNVATLPRLKELVVDYDKCRLENVPRRPHLSYFNSFTIRQELERSIGEWEQSFDDYWLVKDHWWGGEKAFQDPYKRAVFANSAANLFETVNLANDAFDKGLKEATAFFMTLGMSEVFVNKFSGRVVCQKPLYGRGGGAEETDYHMSTFVENYNNLVRIIEILKFYNKDMKIVVTVSPVALERTFSGNDIAVANAEGKSILRAAAGQVSREFDNVTYFPSYEAVIGQGPSAFYESDGRHVNQPVVAEMMNSFVQAYF